MRSGARVGACEGAAGSRRGADEPLVARAETDAEADAQIRRCARTAAGDAGDDGDDAALPTGVAYSFSQ